MSKQSDAKTKQGYVPSYQPLFCMHCRNFKSDIVEMTNGWAKWTEEKNIRCGIGGFAVKKKGTCMEFGSKSEPVDTDVVAEVGA